jgi:hypothetical protein
VVPVLVVVVGVALPVAVPLMLGLALVLVLALAVPDAGVDTGAVGVGNVPWWCLHHDALARLSDPPLTAATAPIVMTTAATGMAITAAIRARR